MVYYVSGADRRGASAVAFLQYSVTVAAAFMRLIIANFDRGTFNS